ncbi:MAG: 5'-methylthioadenosine/S-adenosylhomocysteine nucleosidase [Blastocatellia bacterium]
MNSNRYRALLVRTLTAICLTASLIAASQAQPEAARKNDKDSSGVDIVVQGALDSELQPLLAMLEDKEQIQIAAWTFWKGRIGSKRVVVSRTEVGPINAVAATTLAIVNFKPKLIINQGTAGANDPELKVFDIVVGEATVDYGAFRSSHADAGQGIDMSRWTPLPHRLRIDGKERKTYPRFAGDEEAMRAALETPYKRGRVTKGVIGSAFEFNKEIDRLVWVRKTFGASSEDMESAFSAGAAEGFKTRFLAIRVISDSEFHSPKLEEVAGEYCAAFVVEVIRKIR